MGWFSKTEDYDITPASSSENTDLNVCVEFEGSKYGLHETTNDDGSKHVSHWDGDSNTRHSYDVDSDGNVEHDHFTDQNIPKGEPGRH